MTCSYRENSYLPNIMRRCGRPVLPGAASAPLRRFGGHTGRSASTANGRGLDVPTAQIDTGEETLSSDESGIPFEYLVIKNDIIVPVDSFVTGKPTALCAMGSTPTLALQTSFP